MPNLLQTSAAWLGQQLQSHAGQVVTLRQGAMELSEISATLSQHQHEILDASGFLTKVTLFDWTFVAADLAGLKLRSGALVIDESGNEYEAMPLDKIPAVERGDSSGILLILHTKLVTEA